MLEANPGDSGTNQNAREQTARSEEKEPVNSASLQSQNSFDATGKLDGLNDVREETNQQDNPDRINPNQNGNTVRVKEKEEISTDSLQSPNDPGATYGHKGKGYEFQIAETCNEKNPFEVITETHLNKSNESDQTQAISMLDKLDEAKHRPDECIVDAGYVSGENIVKAEEKGTQLIGPLPGRPPNPENLSLADFEFSEDGTRIEHCPNGKSPVNQEISNDGDSYRTRFSQSDCASCPFHDRCPVKGSSQRYMDWNKVARAVAKRHREVHTKEFKERYKIRSGIEATNSELKNKHGASHLRVRGYASIDFVMVMKSLALNIKRMMQYVLTTATKHTKDPSPASNSCVFLCISIFLAFIRVLGQFLHSLTHKKNFCLAG